MANNLSALIARLEAGPVYLTHKEAYDLAIFFGSDTALGMASLIRKAFAGGSLDAALALAERTIQGDFFWSVHHNAVAVGQKLYRAEVIFSGCGWQSGASRSASLALVSATLRAKQGEG